MTSSKNSNSNRKMATRSEVVKVVREYDMTGARRRNLKRKRNSGDGRSTSFVMEVPASGSGLYRRSRMPNLRSTSDSAMVDNCEVVNNVNTAALGAFATTRVPLHNAQPNWLAGVSGNFSKYRWRAARLIYIPSCPTSTPGSVVMNLGYDFSDTSPASLGAAQSNYRSVTSPQWGGYNGSELLDTNVRRPLPAGSVCLDLDINRMPLSWYPCVVSQAVFNGFTSVVKNTYCPAYVDVSTLGGNATATLIGNVFLHYVCELIEPVQLAQQV